MPKLNQIIAIVNGRKTQTVERQTAAYHLLQKVESLNGLTRVYKPKDEMGEQFPPENKLVQVKAKTVLDTVAADLIELFDIVLTQDSANCLASADIVIDNKVIAAKVPVTYLLFLEKQLIGLATAIAKLPTLDPGEQWQFDPTQDCYRSEPAQTTKGKKTMRSHVKYEATKEHPAQVETYFEDVNVGTWTSTKFSGAVTIQDRNLWSDRVKQLSDAVKMAREAANNLDVDNKKIGEKLMGIIFAK